LGVSVLTGLVIIAAVYPGIGRAADPQTLLYPVIVLLLSALTSVCPLINAWYVMAAGGLIAALSSLFMVAAGEPAYLPMAVVVSLIVCWSMGLSMRISVWMVLVMWDLDRRRQVDARLAVAEERLRFSRD